MSTNIFLSFTDTKINSAEIASTGAVISTMTTAQPAKEPTLIGLADYPNCIGINGTGFNIETPLNCQKCIYESESGDTFEEPCDAILLKRYNLGINESWAWSFFFLLIEIAMIYVLMFQNNIRPGTTDLYFSKKGKVVMKNKYKIRGDNF